MTLLFNNKEGKLDIACDDILRLINKHQDFLFLEENLHLLAYIIWRWESLYNNARIVYSKNEKSDELIQCELPPKNKILNGQVILYKNNKYYKILKSALKVICSENYYTNIENKVKTNEYFDNLTKPVYDEWDILYWKKNKTVNDWIMFFSNKRYKNHTLYQYDKNVLNLIFFTSNSFKWNKEGYLDSIIKTSLFGDFFYSKDLLPHFIKEELYEILYRPECDYVNNKAWRIIEDITNEEIKMKLKKYNLYFDNKLSDKEKYDLYLKDIQQMILNRGSSEIIKKYSITKDSLFFLTPKNVNDSYTEYIISISYEVLKNKELYNREEINLIEKFIKNNPQWFRKRRIRRILEND